MIPEVMEWEDWKQMFQKKYQSTLHHETSKATYLSNVQYIKNHNSQGHSYTLGVNQFADLTIEQFRNTYLATFNRTRKDRVVWLTNDAPATVDWRDHNAVTAVKDQGQCGSCWSFSTTGSVEGADAIKSGNLQSFSEQQLVECDHTDSACNGGLMDYAFQYIIKNNGIDTEGDYPYTSGSGSVGTCNTSKQKKHVGTISSFQDVAQLNADQFAKAVAIGPVSVAIEADQTAFQLYKTGVFSAACGTNLDHGVLAVGYGADFWIVKNSWGATWGMDGYIELSRSVGGSAGQCGILSQPSYPIAGEAPPSPGPSPGPSGSHYKNPYTDGCSSDDIDVSITGVDGAICVPKCDTSSPCPSAPSSFTDSQAQCVLQMSDGTKACALICDPTETGACDPNDSATCKSAGGAGICTYDESGPGPSPGPTEGPYENPANGCSSGEQNLSIDSITGSFCAPQCDSSGACPDPSSSMTGYADCSLQTPDGTQYCALTCITDIGMCDEADGMTCKEVPGQILGICTWDDGEVATFSKSLSAKTL